MNKGGEFSRELAALGVAGLLGVAAVTGASLARTAGIYDERARHAQTEAVRQQEEAVEDENRLQSIAFEGGVIIGGYALARRYFRHE